MSASRLASRCRLCPSIAGALACVFSTAGKEGDDDDDAEDEGVVVVVCDSGAGGFELLRPLFFCFRALFRSSLSPLPRSCSTSSSSESMSISARLLLFQSQGRMKAEQGTSRKETKGAKQGEREGAKKQRRCCCLLPFLALFVVLSFFKTVSNHTKRSAVSMSHFLFIWVSLPSFLRSTNSSSFFPLAWPLSFVLKLHTSFHTHANKHTYTYTHTHKHTHTNTLTHTMSGRASAENLRQLSIRVSSVELKPTPGSGAPGVQDESAVHAQLWRERERGGGLRERFLCLSISWCL